MVCSFHFIKNDSFDLFLTILVNLVSPAFLHEIEFIQQWSEWHVSVNTKQVVPILGICTWERITCKILTCPCIHVSIDWSFKHVKERITDWVLLTATTGQMLKNVRSPLWIRWKSFEDCGECIVFVISLKVIHFGSCLLMDQLIDLNFKVFWVVTW